ncbi:MAG: hypothetical protein P9M08_02065 [Candidatus Erginobacter occultus]|nr:hypothetical protein [Candidatus Erginobacter occultus]
MAGFDLEIWPQIKQIAQQHKEREEPILTIGQGSRNWVLAVDDDKIVVISEKDQRGQPVGAPREVPREIIKEAFEILAANGTMNRKLMVQKLDNKIRVIGAIIRGILALLPNVKVEQTGRSSSLVYYG